MPIQINTTTFEYTLSSKPEGQREKVRAPKTINHTIVDIPEQRAILRDALSKLAEKPEGWPTAYRAVTLTVEVNDEGAPALWLNFTLDSTEDEPTTEPDTPKSGKTKRSTKAAKPKVLRWQCPSSDPSDPDPVAFEIFDTTMAFLNQTVQELLRLASTQKLGKLTRAVENPFWDALATAFTLSRFVGIPLPTHYYKALAAGKNVTMPSLLAAMSTQTTISQRVLTALTTDTTPLEIAQIPARKVGTKQYPAKTIVYTPGLDTLGAKVRIVPRLFSSGPRPSDPDVLDLGLELDESAIEC